MKCPDCNVGNRTADCVLIIKIKVSLFQAVLNEKSHSSIYMYAPEYCSRGVHVVHNEVGGASSDYHSLHLLFTALHEVRQVVLLGNIAAGIDLPRT